MSLITSLSSRRRSEGGQTLVIFAIFLVVLMGATAIAVDYGSLLKVRRDYQNVADAAVLAGSVFLTRPVTATKQIAARKAAWESIKDQLGLTLDATLLAATDRLVGPANGYLEGGYRMWVSTSPLGGPTAYAGDYSGNNRVLFAWVEKDSPQFFSGVFGLGDRTVSGWATAGTFPNRYAIITLRKSGQPTMGNPTDIDVNGNTKLHVFDGDVGGNWGMAVNGLTSAVVMHSSTGDSYGVYLTENVPTGGNGWIPSQVRTSGGTAVAVQYHAEVADPAYPAPCLTTTCLVNRTVVWGNSYSATTTRVGETCPATGLNILAPGRYNNIRVPNGKCLVLDPTLLPEAGMSNGIYYFTGDVDLDNNALIVGDGVTLVFSWSSSINKFNMNADASISLNNGDITRNPLAASCNPNCKFAGWTARAGGVGNLSWSSGIGPTYASPPDPFERGIAAYVCRSAANCGSGGGPSTDILQMNSGAGIDYRGLIYAPFDNVKLAGQTEHDDIGQLVAWTVQFTGGSEINQTWDGPDQVTPVLLEPRLGQ